VGVSLTGVCGADFSGSKNDVTAFDTGGNCCATSVCPTKQNNNKNATLSYYTLTRKITHPNKIHNFTKNPQQ